MLVYSIYPYDDLKKDILFRLYDANVCRCDDILLHLRKEGLFNSSKSALNSILYSMQVDGAISTDGMGSWRLTRDGLINVCHHRNLPIPEERVPSFNECIYELASNIAAKFEDDVEIARIIEASEFVIRGFNFPITDIMLPIAIFVLERKGKVQASNATNSKSLMDRFLEIIDDEIKSWSSPMANILIETSDTNTIAEAIIEVWTTAHRHSNPFFTNNALVEFVSRMQD